MTTWAAVVSLAIGSALVSLVLFGLGSGDPRWNLPGQYHMSLERLDFYTALAIAWIPGLFAGLVGTRRLLRMVLVMAGTVVATSLVWQFEIRPQHTNEISWQLAGFPLLIVAGTMIGSAVVIARLLRP
jgi:hypothetical protein